MRIPCLCTEQKTLEWEDKLAFWWTHYIMTRLSKGWSDYLINQVAWQSFWSPVSVLSALFLVCQKVRIFRFISPKASEVISSHFNMLYNQLTWKIINKLINNESNHFLQPYTASKLSQTRLWYFCAATSCNLSANIYAYMILMYLW